MPAMKIRDLSNNSGQHAALQSCPKPNLQAARPRALDILPTPTFAKRLAILYLQTAANMMHARPTAPLLRTHVHPLQICARPCCQNVQHPANRLRPVLPTMCQHFLPICSTSLPASCELWSSTPDRATEQAGGNNSSCKGGGGGRGWHPAVERGSLVSARAGGDIGIGQAGTRRKRMC